MKMPLTYYKIGIVLVLFALLCSWALYSGLVVRKYIIRTDRFGADKGFRIVLLSDLHSCIYGKDQTELINKVKEQKPDIILLSGDIVDDVTPVEGVRLLLNGLQGTAPMYYVSGNHEYWSGEITKIKDLIRSYGVVVLEDEYQEISIKDMQIIVAGIDDPEWVRYESKEGSVYANMDTAFKSLDGMENYKILVAHRPELVEIYKKYNFDLAVSGHAHGGQVRIPLILNGLYAPNQGWFPKHAGGAYTHGRLTHVVSRGLSKNPMLPRVFNPPEVVVIDVIGN